MGIGKQEKLKGFLATLPPKVLSPLAMAVERDRLMGRSDLPHDMIMEGLRPALRRAEAKPQRVPTPLRLFCVPFEDLIVPGPRPNQAPSLQKKHGRIFRSSIQPIWHWLGSELLPHLHNEQCRALTHAILEGDQKKIRHEAEELHRTGAAAIQRALSGVEVDSPRHRRLAERLGGTHVVEDAREMAWVLEAAGELLDLQDRLERPVEEFDPNLAEPVRRTYDMLAEHMPDSAPYAVLVAMGRLRKPWQILRVVKIISRNETDFLASRTDLRVIGDLLMSDLEDVADAVAATDARDFDPQDLIDHLRVFTELSGGITKEMGLRKEGEWGQRLVKARGRISDAMDSLMERAPKEVGKAIPFNRMGTYGGRGAKKPDVSNHPNAERSEQALKLAQLIGGARPYASAGAFSVAYNEATGELREVLTTYANQIVEQIHKADPEDRPIPIAYGELCVRLSEPILGEEEAALLQRRITAAAKPPGTDDD